MTKPIALIVCDGWGLNPRRDHNAIALARTPHFDALNAQWQAMALQTAGLAVGLPEGQMGNSEVGHMNMGAGRVVYQELTRIDKEIREGQFFENPVLKAAMAHAREQRRPLHLMGLLSDGGVHSSLAHMFSLVEFAKREGVEQVWIHAFLDGRDTAPTSGAGFLAQTEQRLRAIGLGRIASISGRYYAMDRDNNWNRTELAYRALVNGQGQVGTSSSEAIAASYAAGLKDEFLLPTIIDPAGLIQKNDAILFFNFRPDRARQITRALTDPAFATFLTPTDLNVHFTCLTQYDATFPLPVAYRPQQLVDNLASVLAGHRVRQLHTAETEKYAHVTFFFNCGREEPYPLENRILIPSPKVATYDLKPEMSAPEVAAGAAAAIDAGHADVLIMNFANADMVGHTGNMAATILAVEAVDAAVGRVVAAIHRAGGIALVTADHGNAEQMVDYETGEAYTSHTTNPVPLLLTGRKLRLRESGVLADIAPTILDLLDMEQPSAMTATSLIAR